MRAEKTVEKKIFFSRFNLKVFKTNRYKLKF